MLDYLQKKSIVLNVSSIAGGSLVSGLGTLMGPGE